MSIGPELKTAPTRATISYRINYDKPIKGVRRLGPRLARILRDHNFTRRKSDIDRFYIWDNDVTMPSSVALALEEFWHEAQSTDEKMRILTNFQVALK